VCVCVCVSIPATDLQASEEKLTLPDAQTAH